MGGFTVRHARQTPVVIAGGAPANLLMILQGQTSPNSTPSAPTPPFPDQMSLAWDAVGGASSYKIYRTAANGSTFSLYDTSASNTYTDLGAIGCVGVTAGSAGPPPVANYVANTYLYKVSAVVSGVETAQSTTQKFQVYKNGVASGWGGDYSFPNPGVNCFIDYNDTVGDPAGCVKFNFTGASFAGFQPYMGNNMTLWNAWSGAFNFLTFDLKPTISGQTWQLNPLRVGDVPIYNTSGGQTAIVINGNLGPVPTNGQWDTYKIALSTMLNDYGSAGTGPPVIQRAIYKFAIQDTTGNASGTFYMRNVFYSAT